MTYNRNSYLSKFREKRAPAVSTPLEDTDLVLDTEKLQEQPNQQEDDDEILQNLREMVDNLLMDPIPNEETTNETPKDVSVSSSSSLTASKGKTTPSRRNPGRSRGYCEIFGIYSPPSVQQYPLVQKDGKTKAAAKTVLSLFDERPQQIIVTLPTTQRRLARMANMNTMHMEWPSLSKDEQKSPSK